MSMPNAVAPDLRHDGQTIDRQPAVVGNAFSSLLDALRWIAATIVALSHIRALCWVEGSGIEHANLPMKAFYALTSMGVEAVAVFFVLSGFLVGGANYHRAANGTFGVRRYAVDRFTRIYTVLVPVLLCVAVIDGLGRHIFADSLFYSSGNVLVAERFGLFNTPSVQGFFLTIAALQDLWARVFGSDVPLWSLSYEIWFYVLAGLVLSVGPLRRQYRIAVLTIAAALTAVLGLKFVFFLGLWLIGVVAHQLSLDARRYSVPVRYGALAVLLLSMLAAAQLGVTIKILEVDFNPLLIGVAFACGLTLIVWRTSSDPLALATHRFNTFLASFSFTLYLIHFPIALFVVAGIVSASVPDAAGFAGFQPYSLQGALTFLAATAASFGAAIAIAAITEWRTAHVRKWVWGAITR